MVLPLQNPRLLAIELVLQQAKTNERTFSSKSPLYYSITYNRWIVIRSQSHQFCPVTSLKRIYEFANTFRAGGIIHEVVPAFGNKLNFVFSSEKSQTQRS